MPEVEEAIPMDLRFGDVEVGTDERDQDGVEDVVDEFMKQFRTFL